MVRLHRNAVPVSIGLLKEFYVLGVIYNAKYQIPSRDGSDVMFKFEVMVIMQPTAVAKSSPDLSHRSPQDLGWPAGYS